MLPLDEVPRLRADTPLEEAMMELGDGVGRGVVLDDGRLVGLLSVSDLIRALQVGGGT